MLPIKKKYVYSFSVSASFRVVTVFLSFDNIFKPIPECLTLLY